MLWLVRQGSCDCGNCRGVFVVPWFSRPPPVWTGPSGDMYGIEATSAELRVMHVANQAVCRTLNLLARSKTLSKTQRHRTAVAVLGLGAVPDIVDLIARSDPEVEADPGMWQSVEDMHTYTHTHTHMHVFVRFWLPLTSAMGGDVPLLVELQLVMTQWRQPWCCSRPLCPRVREMETLRMGKLSVPSPSTSASTFPPAPVCSGRLPHMHRD